MTFRSTDCLTHLFVCNLFWVDSLQQCRAQFLSLLLFASCVIFYNAVCPHVSSYFFCFHDLLSGYNISVPKLLRQIKSGDLNPTELWVGGEITEFLQSNDYKKVHRFSGVKETVNALINKIAEDILSCPINTNNTEKN